MLSISIMDTYLKSRSKHLDKLTIFEELDNNINLLCETIYLMGVYDALITKLDNKYKYIDYRDAVGLLSAEFQTRPEFSGYIVWLEQALKEGEYLPSSYQIKDRSLELIDTLFIAGQLSLSKAMGNKGETIIPEMLGLDPEYVFYDFKEFNELKETWKKELED